MRVGISKCVEFGLAWPVRRVRRVQSVALANNEQNQRSPSLLLFGEVVDQVRQTLDVRHCYGKSRWSLQSSEEIVVSFASWGQGWAKPCSVNGLLLYQLIKDVC